MSISNSIILFLENYSNISRIDDPIDLIRFNDNLIWLFELLISSLDENSEISLKKEPNVIIIVTLVTRDNLFTKWASRSKVNNLFVIEQIKIVMKWLSFLDVLNDVLEQNEQALKNVESNIQGSLDYFEKTEWILSLGVV